MIDRNLNLFIVFTLTTGLSLCFGGIVYAQNNTTPTHSEVFGAVTEATIASYTGLLIAITGIATLIIKVFGLDNTRYGKMVTGAADAFHAIYDDRKTLGSFGRVLHSMAPEEQQKFINEKVVPVLLEYDKKADELTPKIIELTDLASKAGKPLASVNFGQKFKAGDFPKTLVVEP